MNILYLIGLILFNALWVSDMTKQHLFFIYFSCRCLMIK
ncbi:hypothetical protein SALWKB29_1340 [Snodgrassella communis]|uniref:Uncharacterized protein n=1 Tax=Snodgrassella communis TaxID=2946699 RepID=A0A836MQH6_9NEIS|nr:hypothetical protein SALWKB29_1340 [Snodgrassella communis]